MTKEIIRYATAGLVNTFVGYGVFIYLVFLDLEIYCANAFGYFVGLCVAFLLNKYYVFNKEKTNIKHIIKFGISFVIAYAINLLTLSFFLNFITPNPAIGQIFAMMCYTVSFYILNKYIVFH